MRKSNSRFLYLVFIIAGLMGFGTYGVNNAIPSAIAQVDETQGPLQKSQELDISIDPTIPLPANGTVTISTEGATDADLEPFPPEGVYIIISNETVTVTNQQPNTTNMTNQTQ
jgi:hypothetical protein